MERLARNGLTMHKNYITEEEESVLIDAIESHQWCHDLARKTQQYGFKYNYQSTKALPTVPMPGWLANLRDDLYPEANSCIINHYKPGQGISPHLSLIHI